MKIKSIKLANFKRFTDLSIEDLPEKAKLVVMIGLSGCGKSSVRDRILSEHAEEMADFYENDTEWREWLKVFSAEVYT